MLWRLHQVHHADRDIDVTTGVRFHPIEIGLSMLWKIAVVVAIGASPLAVLLFEIILNGGSLFTHANIALPRSTASCGPSSSRRTCIASIIPCCGASSRYELRVQLLILGPAVRDLCYRSRARPSRHDDRAETVSDGPADGGAVELETAVRPADGALRKPSGVASVAFLPESRLRLGERASDRGQEPCA